MNDLDEDAPAAGKVADPLDRWDIYDRLGDSGRGATLEELVTFNLPEEIGKWLVAVVGSNEGEDGDRIGIFLGIEDREHCSARDDDTVEIHKIVETGDVVDEGRQCGIDATVKKPAHKLLRGL